MNGLDFPTILVGQAVPSLLLLAVLLISHPKEQRHDWRSPVVGGIPGIGSA